MKSFTIKTIAETIRDKMNGAISRGMIEDVIQITVDYTVNELKNNRALSIKNFGTFSTYVFPKRNSVNISTGEREQVDSITWIKFRAHEAFSKLLEKKRKRFTKK